MALVGLSKRLIGSELCSWIFGEHSLVAERRISVAVMCSCHGGPATLVRRRIVNRMGLGV